jgi:hypothetical protein
MKLIDALEDMPRYIWYVGYFVLGYFVGYTW